MNFFAHGIRFLDEPYFLVGTAIPDMLSVADRKVRMRSRLVEPHVDGSGSEVDLVARGVLQHLNDDDWFHTTLPFYDLSGKLSLMFRELQPPSDKFYPGFLGHIVTEMLLDAVLIEQFPGKIEQYYHAFEEIEPGKIEEVVNLMGTRQTDRLAPLIPRFSHERFLEDYLDLSKMLYRLNQVMRRVTLAPLPDETVELLIEMKIMVERNWRGLLPEDRFVIT
ncbi:hypothetical protein Pla110_31280 [Polystyrenella longa]|uniref:Phospholipase C/D domain-containing protein n=1 Tax=Polystyrenella longa TaxID=2528007 RepID=A0A518CQ78_9PLAN|nr:hypothetical protein [Polystyrenella longa]QDU81387.1 hypothetical protein Pla110_31280 [Polystyrenella longa]